MTVRSEDERFISIDDHVIEPPTVWQDRLPEKHREAGPNWVRFDGGEVTRDPRTPDPWARPCLARVGRSPNGQDESAVHAGVP